MSSVLYISDLDGTLLNSKREISGKSTDLLNGFIKKGGLFTIATARMPYTCDYRLKNLELTMPSILMNGVMLYNFSKGKCIDWINMESDAVERVLSIIEASEMSAYLYTFEHGKISLYFDDDKLGEEGQYYNARSIKGCGYAGKVPSLRDINFYDAIYMALTGSESAFEAIEASLKEVPGITYTRYLNIYNGKYCVEIYSDKASKEKRVQQLKQALKADEVVYFGDNTNDQKAMIAADRSYAPDNALPEIKVTADGILGSHDDDSVAKFIANEK